MDVSVIRPVYFAGLYGLFLRRRRPLALKCSVPSRPETPSTQSSKSTANQSIRGLLHSTFGSSGPVTNPAPKLPSWNTPLSFCRAWSCHGRVRYFKETANTRMSMNMVYIREAVYDKVQRVGFGFHDVHSSGQLINRALRICRASALSFRRPCWSRWISFWRCLQHHPDLDAQ